ncbi:S-DNA-T family DNA segregation ATPase FtsK/SpoIIIE [Catenulispora sp. GP43]|uniref:cell division protein FtsK n=1 Tax=Catenulispora sp. GP43 TaxID=3156263 RepID=UPI003510EA90
MTTQTLFPDDDDDGADIFDFPPRDAGQPPADTEDSADGYDPFDPDADDADDFDRESVEDDAPRIGGPVDVVEDIPTVRPDDTSRRPVIPEWAKSREGRQATYRNWLRRTKYAVAFHAVRLPKYTAKTTAWSAVGAARLVPRLLYWASAERGNFALRQAAADTNDPKTWLALDSKRQRQAVARWWILAFGTGTALVIAFMLAMGVIPAWWGWAGLAAALPGLVRAGRPADKRVVDRVREAKVYRKLTAELVRRALMSCQISGITSAVAKDPHAISFPTEIHRSGPGHMAIVDLPYGVEASDVIARRGRLASGMRLPLDQVWPEHAGGHTGRLALWVGFEPSSQMKRPPWPLVERGEVDVFAPFPFATTPRLEPVAGELMFRNWLFGGQPGSGKTRALRLLVLAAALDARAEIRGYELKGVGDFEGTRPVMAEYGNGFDDDTIGAAAGMLTWLYEECERRSKRIAHYHKAGKAPENKVTPELAGLKGSGLHPLVVFIDEAQELFAHAEFGDAAGKVAEKVIKLGRALGVILLLGTQIPDKKSLPTGITRNINSRFCLSVADQTANDMILGTSAYKNGLRATVFKPVEEAGWGVLAGLGKAGSRCSYYVDGADLDKVMARAIALRTAAGTMPEGTAARADRTPAYDLLADVLAVWPDKAGKAWNETIVTALAALRPEIYDGWESAQLTAALKPFGVPVVDVGKRINGTPTTKRGIARADIATAVTERDRKRRAA